MLRAVVLVAAASRVFCRTNVSTTSVKPESLELLNVIKQDLRKNNDDYVEQTPQAGAPGSALNVTVKSNLNRTTTPEHNQFHKKRLQDTRRNALPVSKLRNFQFSATDLISTDGQQFNTNSHTKLPLAVARSLAGMLRAQGYTNQYPKYSGAANRLKMFIDKNKDKMQEYVKNKKQLVKDGVKMKAYTTSEETDTEEAQHRLPSVDQLDMAPAIGGRVHSMRLKGRLCQRSVLMPEGPKYDSKGVVYLREYGAGGERRPYDGTAPPPLLLPRCCNCCKKSVLGCE